MNRFRWWAAAGFGLLLAVSLVQIGRRSPGTRHHETQPVMPTAQAPGVTPAPSVRPTNNATAVVKDSTPAGQFDAWAKEFSAATPEQKSALLARGEAVARARREQMIQLIQQKP